MIERVGDARLRVYLYHIPQVSRVPLGLALIERLRPPLSGHRRGHQGQLRRLEQHAGDAGAVPAAWFSMCSPGSETFLLAMLRAGGAGCISATANVNPAAIAQSHGGPGGNPTPTRDRPALDGVRAAFQKFPMIPALKAAIGHFSGDGGGHRATAARCPCQRSAAAAVGALNALGFAMPGLAG